MAMNLHQPFSPWKNKGRILNEIVLTGNCTLKGNNANWVIQEKKSATPSAKIFQTFGEKNRENSKLHVQKVEKDFLSLR